MATPAPDSQGFLPSLRALSDDLLATVQDRVELFSIELHEEKLRLIQTFIWISAAIFAGMMTVAFGSLTLVYYFWESARLAVLGGLTLLYAAALGAIIVACRRFLRRQPVPFPATREEIAE